jgi:hypothetical protein
VNKSNLQFPDDFSTGVTIYESERAFAGALPSLTPGIYVYVVTSERLYRVVLRGANNFPYQIDRRRRCYMTAETPAFISDMEVLLNNDAVDNAYAENVGEGSYYFLNSDSEYEKKNTRIPDRLFFFRGLQYPQEGLVGFLANYTSTHQYRPATSTGALAAITVDGTTVATADRSLLWSGDYGLYEKSWQRWHSVIGSGKPVTQRFTIPVSIFTQFNFQDKVRVGNMDYFIKSLSVERLTADRHFVVEANMFSTI